MTMPIAKAALLESLPAIECEFEEGHYVTSCYDLWQATKRTFLMLGREHGLETDDIRAIANALEEKGLSKRSYRAALSSGELARVHAEMQALEYHEIEFAHHVALKSIREICREPSPNDAAG